jgi:hypothetical protein
LHRSFMGFGGALRGKSSEIPPFPRLGIFLAGVQAVFALQLLRPRDLGE